MVVFGMRRFLAGQTVLYRVHDAMRSTRGIQSALTQGMNPGACAQTVARTDSHIKKQQTEKET